MSLADADDLDAYVEIRPGAVGGDCRYAQPGRKREARTICERKTHSSRSLPKRRSQLGIGLVERQECHLSRDQRLTEIVAYDAFLT